MTQPFSIFDITNEDLIDELHSKLWDELVPENGDAPSVQGEMIRALGRISSEMFRNANNNWIYDKFDTNLNGYSVDYFNSEEYYDNGEEGELPDPKKCSTTQHQLDTASYFDEMLNFVQEWLDNHPLPEWGEDFRKKLHDALESARPSVPVGVISDDHWEEYVKENDLQYTSGWDAWDSDPNSSFANAQVVYWIYRNPELIDSNGKSLNKSVAKVFSDLTLTNKEH